MWCQRRVFPLNVLHREIGTNNIDRPDFVTSLNYAMIPIFSEDSAAPSGSIEYFICGLSDGRVIRYTIPPVHDKEDEKDVNDSEKVIMNRTVFCPSHAPRGGYRSGREDAGVDGCDFVDVLCVDVHETLVATCGHHRCHVNFFHPDVENIVTIEHPKPVRCCRLWEGRSDLWSNEDTIVYVFTGCDDGAVRLFRVDVVEKTYFLHSVFAVQLSGGIGDSSEVPTDDTRGVPLARLIASPIYSLVIDGSSSCSLRLLAAMDKRWACWDLDSVGARAQMVSEGVVKDEGGRSSRSAASVTLPATETGFLNISLFARSDLYVMGQLKQEPGDVKYSKWKPKHETVCGGFEVGHCLNYGERLEDGLFCVPAVFPSLKNTLMWPSTCFGKVEQQMLFASADTEGPVFSMVKLQSGRFVTAGADGGIRVWEWRPEDRKYALRHHVERGDRMGHADLIKTVCVLRSPDIFLSCGYDGFVKEWHIYDDPEVLMCQNTLSVGVAQRFDPAKTSVGHRLGVSSAVVFPPFNALFLVGLFESVVRTYTILDVDTCELPPNFVFDGWKTVYLPVDPTSAPSEELPRVEELS